MKNSISTKTIAVYDKIGTEYLKYSSKIPPYKRDEFIKLLPKGASILDAGCGGGRDSKFFTQKGFNVTGIDLSSGQITIAKTIAPKATFKVMDLLKLDFHAESFDAIWAQASLLHLKRSDAKKVIKNFAKLLKPNGILHIRVKKGVGEAWVKEQLSGGMERFFTYFGKREIEQNVKDFGLKIIYSGFIPDETGRKNVKWIVVWSRKPAYKN